MQEITLTRPDDWHLHLRDGVQLAAVVADTARQFGRAIVMPNLRPPITTVAAAAAYRERILAALPPGSDFQPLMTLYLTDETAPEELAAAKASGFVHAVKLYPAGATTNSNAGVTDLLGKCAPALAALEALQLPFLVHGEITDPTTDIFDREALFIERVMQPVLDKFPRLKVVFEHITTQQAADFVQNSPSNVAATITAHHLLMNRNALFTGGIRPHHYCLPVLKREVHRQALLAAVGSGSTKFFLGTDSAPHSQSAKEQACGCAGMYTAFTAMALYAEAFESMGALDKLNGFASQHGPAFYGLPENTGTITLEKTDWLVPATLPYGAESLIPLRAGEMLPWRFKG